MTILIVAYLTAIYIAGYNFFNMAGLNKSWLDILFFVLSPVSIPFMFLVLVIFYR